MPGSPTFLYFLLPLLGLSPHAPPHPPPPPPLHLALLTHAKFLLPAIPVPQVCLLLLMPGFPSLYVLLSSLCFAPPPLECLPIISGSSPLYKTPLPYNWFLPLMQKMLLNVLPSLAPSPHACLLIFMDGSSHLCLAPPLMLVRHWCG